MAKDKSKSVMSILSVLQEQIPGSKETPEIEKAEKKLKRKKRKAVKESSVFQQPPELFEPIDDVEGMG